MQRTGSAANLEWRLRTLLDRDAASIGGIKASRGNKINRKHYAGLLDFDQCYLVVFCGDVFEEYEARYKIRTGPLARLEEMREWLEQEYSSGQLSVRDDKVDRTTFMKRFGHKGGTLLTRHEPIRDLFAEFDRRVAETGYRSKEVSDGLNRLRAVLARGPKLDKDRLTIVRADLAREAGVSEAYLRDGLFKAAIAEQEKQIRAVAKASRIDPFFHGRVFVFSELAPVWVSNSVEH